MKVTDMLVSHHAMLRSVCNEIECAMGEAETTEEIVALAKVLAGLIRDHAEAETSMLFAPLDAMLMEKGQDFGDTNPEKAKLIKQMVVEAPDTAKPVEIGRVEAEEEFADIAPSQPIKRKPGRPASVLKESLAGLKGTLPTEVLE